jgi:hypothetical protein
MNQLNEYLAHHEIDRRLRAVDHDRRVRRGAGRTAAHRSQLAACIGR